MSDAVATPRVEVRQTISGRLAWFDRRRLFWIALGAASLVYSQTQFWNQPSISKYFLLDLSNYDDGSDTWEHWREALPGSYGACRESQTPLVVVLFPVYTKKLDESYDLYPEDFKSIHQKVTNVFSGKEGVLVVDMLEDLARIGLTIRNLRVPIDGHPNRVWHDIVARRLSQTFGDLGLESNRLR